MGQPKDSEFKDRDTMTLDLDDGGKLECIVLNVFPVNNREYIALLPMNDEGHVEEDAQIFLYRFEELGDDEVNLETIEDDDEFELVSDYFDEMLERIRDIHASMRRVYLQVICPPADSQPTVSPLR